MLTKKVEYYGKYFAPPRRLFQLIAHFILNGRSTTRVFYGEIFTARPNLIDVRKKHFGLYERAIYIISCLCLGQLLWFVV